MRLDRLIGEVDVVEVRGDPAATDVSAVTHDSRVVAPGALFCCVPGAGADGHDYAPQALAAGAAALLVERPLPLEVTQVVVTRARPAMAHVAAAFFGHPSRAMDVVGVTGTNGKTTTTHLLHAVLERAGRPAGLIGTLSHPDGAAGADGAGGPGVRVPPTTPEAPELQALLAALAAEGARAVAMEVSSHALAQHRVDGMRFSVAVFTNLSPEHLDFHGSMEEYFRAKASLFDRERAALGVVNADDPYGRRLLESIDLPVRPFSLSEAEGLATGPGGSSFRWQGRRIRLQLAGTFNVANALAAATAALELGVDPADVAEGLSSIRSVPGRFEPVDAGQPFRVVVDYAHTPSGLQHVLGAARALAPTGRVIAVFGCGGERDRAKRPAMGRVATELADLAVLTSDNPRGEDPLGIIEEVRAGVRRLDRLTVEPDRRAAIAGALAGARPGDVVVIAGKGHESVQLVGGRALPFDDRRVAGEELERLVG